MNTASIIQKIWSYCDVLRDVGVSYGDYLEQLTYLLFLKMADEYGKPPYNRDIGIPEEYTWPKLKKQRGAELESFYVKLLRELGRQKGMLGQIFTKAQNKIQDPAMLYRVIDMIDKEQWTMMGADLKGRWRKFNYEEIISRDKASLDILWLKDANLTDLDNLPEPEVLVEEIVENIAAALASFREVASELNGGHG